MSLLGGAYDDSDSDGEPTTKPTPAPVHFYNLAKKKSSNIFLSINFV